MCPQPSPREHGRRHCGYSGAAQNMVKRPVGYLVDDRWLSTKSIGDLVTILDESHECDKRAGIITDVTKSAPVAGTKIM